MQHPLTASQRLWLAVLARSPGLSLKFAKVKLHGELPRDFSPDQIDSRLYFAGRPTPIGLWLVDQDNSLFHAMDRTVLDVQRRIRADPTLTTVTAAEIAEQTQLTEQAIGEALYALGHLGHFFSQATGMGGNPTSHSSIELTDDTAYDEYLRYTELAELLERVYIQRGEGLRASLAYSERAEPGAESYSGGGASDARRVEHDYDSSWDGVSPEVQAAIRAGWANGVPETASALYGRWWQLETWLRSIVYVELRAALGSKWSDELPKVSESRQLGEYGLHHMVTPDAQNRLAYTDASALFRIMQDHWNLFERSLLSKTVWIGRVEELLAIRNRIGHCRRPHSDDLVRLEQTLRDLNPGAIMATSSFNQQSRVGDSWTDPVADGWRRMNHSTAVRLVKHAEQQYDTSFELRCSARPWVAPLRGKQATSGTPGYIWHAFWYFRGGRSFDLRGFWRDIEPFHEAVLLVCSDGPSSVNVSFSAMDDPSLVADSIGRCFDAALYRIGTGGSTDDDLTGWRERYSEIDPRVHVLTPWSSIDESMGAISVFGA